ncbi:phosphohydrolase [Acidovorax sp. sif1233]|uniref:HD-GYP domain-containing protein n=1 Tax=Acidovorax sp. sif1233 TaxID=2854792 RepID=UPI001C4809D2|nr:HD domain-containing phosphohydrolase [Acidovorax sp. sif1233]MBV7455564.1 phosphohydrolase [Acidovorax sp. sif1233]
MQLLKLVESKVRVGVPLPWNVRNQDCTLLLARGHVIRNDSQLEALLERGMFVDIEEFKAVQALAAPAAKPPESIYTRWALAIDALESALPHLGETSDSLDAIQALADEILELADADPDIGLFMAVRQDHAKHLRYGYSHAVYTALLGILMARQLGWAAVRIRQIALAALTMNASIAELQGQMAAQDYPALDRQRTQIRAHPALSAALLEKAGVTDAEWIAAVMQHHEQPDGSGYPHGISSVSDTAQVLRMADLFMARISPRQLRQPLSIQDAARLMFRDDKGGPFSTATIKVLGIYPPGDFVKLASGEMGVVMRRGAEARTPLVAAVTDSQGKSVTSTLQRDTSQAAYAITGPATDRSLLARVPPERLYGYAVHTG